MPGSAASRLRCSCSPRWEQPCRQPRRPTSGTATLTPGNLGGYYGCDNDIASAHCSTATLLSDDDFTHGSTDYSVTGLYVSGGRLTIKLTPNITSASNAALSLVVGSSNSFAFADGGTISGARVWSSTGLTWTSGTAVNVKITATNTAPTVANAIPDQAATVGTSFSYQFPLSTFADAEGDALTYTATKADGNDLPTWLGFTGSTRTFAGTPQAADVETLAVKVTASDGTDSVSDEFNIVVVAGTTCKRARPRGQDANLDEHGECGEQYVR